MGEKNTLPVEGERPGAADARTAGRGPVVSRAAVGLELPGDRAAADAADEQSRARADAPGTHPEFDRLVRTVWRLRQEDGCPWDRAQTHQTLERSLVEETYEAVDAIERGSDVHLAEELGDVLMQVLLHAEIAREDGSFTIDDVCRQINQKLVRRHPHVFGDAAAQSEQDVGRIWADVKRREREARAAMGEGGADTAPEGLLDSVPRSLPALLQCQKISERAARAGFEWASEADVWDQVASERRELEAEPAGSEARALEFGDVLFSLVNVARWEGIDAEAALAASNRKFRSRWGAMQAMARERGVRLDQLDTAELNRLWGEAKRQERGGGAGTGAAD
ncbi:MAG: nucleoside triphosphate pyrophosphohydrolase [Coriobacteriaceae bacterium]|nr:MAG: nucleoside triphosphate pyrophosphohydrolase [Coriobacteriaceae bacterium]